jgi:hypothetical protein
MRRVSLTILEKVLLASPIVCSIILDGVIGDLVLIRHRASGHSQTTPSKTLRFNCSQPIKMFLTPVFLGSVAVMVLVHEFLREFNQPTVIVQRFQ